MFASLAAFDVAGREAELDQRVGNPVDVVVAADSIARGERIDASSLAVRKVPSSYLPRLSYSEPAEVVGSRAAVPIEAGVDLQSSLLEGAQPGGGGALSASGSGERVVRLIAVGSASEIAVGSRVDLLITRDVEGGGASTRIGLSGAEVIESRASGPLEDGPGAGLPRVALALRVTLRQAVLVAQAQSSARELRALPRPPEEPQ